ncbi:MAG: 23S rRNA (guanosine(2251)-2'-O)-methyltransferase RlmB [Bacteroidota bacterium]|nr:23S rRNA (guanosine(2251)-2'-O)-methyltransferase RlmB [Bacteroidota bacterium]
MKQHLKDWIIGKNALKEALNSEASLQKVFLQDSLEKEILYDLLKQSRKKKIPVLQVPKSKLDKMVGPNHQGVAALINPIQFIKIEDLVDKIFLEGHNPALLILDQITDVRNFGAIARSAEVFGLHGIIITQKNSAPINQEAIKASAGALLNIPICMEKSLHLTVKKLKNMGLQIIALSESATMSIREVDFQKALAFILGSEGEGIAEELLESADLEVSIPQRGKINSLNVSVAAGIVCYQWTEKNGMTH